jgi:hypothetical protein
MNYFENVLHNLYRMCQVLELCSGIMIFIYYYCSFVTDDIEKYVKNYKEVRDVSIMIFLFSLFFQIFGIK